MILTEVPLTEIPLTPIPNSPVMSIIAPQRTHFKFLITSPQIFRINPQVGQGVLLIIMAQGIRHKLAAIGPEAIIPESLPHRVRRQV